MQFFPINMDFSALLCHDNSMNSSFDMVFDEELLTVFRHISRALGFRMSILDHRFREVAPLDRQPLCAYCRMVQQDLGLLERCRENDRRRCRAAEERGRALSYTCHGGLKESVYPFFLQGECIGYFLVGQFRTPGEEPGDLLLRAAPSQRNALLKAYRSLPVYRREKQESALEIIRFLTEYIRERRMVSLKQGRLTDRIVTLIRRDFTAHIRVEEAARAEGRSVSSLNQSLKSVTGRSFKQLALSLKMNEAARLLQEHPEMPVAEAGRRVGMEDPFYFSRIFRKYKGASPRAYRRTAASPENND